MVIASLIAACALAGLLFLGLALRSLRRRRAVTGTVHGLSAVTLFVGAAAVGLLGLNLQTYQRLTREQPALKAEFVRTGNRQFDAVLTYPSGAVQRFALRGDEWQIDARVLKWRAFVTVVGFDTAFRLERISGRYRDIGSEHNAVRSVHSLNAPTSIDAWDLLRQYHEYVPWVDAIYGSATYLPMADGASYSVQVSATGLTARPLNQAARQAVGGWR